jgi:aminoglycoside phosphotransferase (APT) family kinase protein
MSWDWTPETRSKLATELVRLGLSDGKDLPTITPIGDGHSNLTYRVDTDQTSAVLRRPPPPPLPPGSNDVLREARIQSALNETQFPVTEVIATGEAGSLFDVPYYIMSMVEGEVITASMPSRFDTPDRRRQIGFELIRTIAELHLVRWQAIGLSNLGRPEGFNARHLNRMASILTDEDRAKHPEFGEIQQWLESNCPEESGSALIHNDCRIGNVMWAFDDIPRIAAVLDWELATIGDPMLDLAYTLSSLPREGECRHPVQDFAAACLGEGFPDQQALLAHYFDVSGAGPVDLDWYMAMVNWKLAVLYAYSHRKGVDNYYQDETHVPRLIAEARHYVDTNR